MLAVRRARRVPFVLAAFLSVRTIPGNSPRGASLLRPLPRSSSRSPASWSPLFCRSPKAQITRACGVGEQPYRSDAVRISAIARSPLLLRFAFGIFFSQGILLLLLLLLLLLPPPPLFVSLFLPLCSSFSFVPRTLIAKRRCMEIFGHFRCRLRRRIDF